jgi:glutamate:Na+ symporter, ESS family
VTGTIGLVRADYSDAQWVGLAFVVLAIVLGGSTALRRNVRLLRTLFIPTAVIAGFLILLIGPQALGEWTDTAGLLPAEVLDVWTVLPGLLINVVFAAVMLGKTLPPVRQIWDRSAPHVILGSVFSFGQFALGSFVVVFVLNPLFDLDELAGSILELSFAGGHGTLAGMGPILTDAGAPELVDLGLGLATISMITGIVGGSLIVRYGLSNPNIPVARQDKPTGEEELDLTDIRVAPSDTRAPSNSNRGMGPVTVGFTAIGVAIAVAIAILEALRAGFGAIGVEVFDDFPLFPFTVIGGFLVQLVATRIGFGGYIEKRVVAGISSVSLDILIACAIGTMSLATLGANVPALVILTIVAVAWSVVGMLVLGPRIHPADWFEHSLADFGQSQGNVATGFVLADMADPERRTDTADAYGYKQLTYEPLLGGGLITALSIPLLQQWSTLTFGLVSTLVTALLIAWGILRARRRL